jgi:GNAT superfamily N-acetyltransferase
MYSQQTTTDVHRAGVTAGTPLQLRSGRTLWVRPFDMGSVADYRQVVDVDNAIDPEHADSVENWQHWDRNRNPEHYLRRFIAEREGAVVAYGQFGHSPWSFREDKYVIWVGVHPDQERKGYGSALWDYLMAQAAKREPGELVSYTRENRARAMHFLEKRGFAPVLRMPISRINPQQFDPAPFGEKLARVEQSGIAIKTLAELRELDPDWLQKTFDLDWECVQDVPSVDGHTWMPLEEWKHKLLDSPNFLPEGWFVAVDGDDYVGLTMLWRDSMRGDKLGTGLTGVVRSHRRRGIATALKATALTFARDRGIVEVDTDNEENNPMLQLNLQLGFRSLPALVELRKQVKGASPV